MKAVLEYQNTSKPTIASVKMSRKHNTKHPERGKSNYPKKGRRLAMLELKTLKKRQECPIDHNHNVILCGGNHQ